MIIAVPVTERENTDKIAQTFGRAPFFLIYDAETKEEKVLDNSAIASQGGAGIKAAQVIADSGADALIVPQVGSNAADVLDEADVKIYQAEGDSVKENIVACVEGRIQLLS